MKKETHKDFIRISWDDAFMLMTSALQAKYNACGKVVLKKDHGYDGVGDFYDVPTFVDIELREE